MSNEIETIATDLAAKIAEAGKYIAQAKALRAAAGPMLIRLNWDQRELGADANSHFGNLNMTEKDEIISNAICRGFRSYADELQAKAQAIIDALSSKPEGRTDADRETIRIAQRSEIVEEFIRSLDFARCDDYQQTLIIGNIRNFARSDRIAKLAALDAGIPGN